MRKGVFLFFISLSFWTVYGNNVTVLHNFDGTDGNDPKGTLIEMNGVLYGRTAIGGSNNEGVIFSVQKDGSSYNILFNFPTGANNGVGKQPHHDKMFFQGANLIGTALEGGTNDNGTIFSIAPNGSNYQVLHQFVGSPADGASPHSNAIPFNSFFYGLTAAGGANNQGTVYSMQPDGSQFQVVYSFATPTGSNAHGHLSLNSNTTALVGMTKDGGTFGNGVIFSLTNFAGVAPTPTYTVLHEFGSIPGDGATTDHGSLLLIGTTLYGLTTNGGLNNNGVIFSLDQSGSGYQLLHTFGQGVSNDGLQPYGSLVLSPLNIIYGMTRNGGSHGGSSGNGTIFQIMPNGTGYGVVTSFKTEEGTNPIDDLIVSSDGLTLYGMTQSGGANGFGTVFAYKIPPELFPPQIRNTFQAKTLPVSMKSLTSLATASAMRQIAALTERQSSYRGACWRNCECPENFEVFQKKINITLADSYMRTNYFAHRELRSSKSRANATILMADTRVNPHLFLGAAGGYLQGKTSFSHSMGGTELKSGLAALYATVLFDRFFTDLVGGYAWNFYDTHRNIATFNQKTTAHPKGHQSSFESIMGYYIKAGHFVVTPLAGLLYFRNDVHHYRESGASAFTMHVRGYALDSLHTMVGLRLGRSFCIRKINFLPELQARWEHECLDTSKEVHTFFRQDKFHMKVATRAQDRNFYFWGGSLTAFFTTRFLAEITYIGEYSPHNLQASALTGSLTFTF